MTVRPALLILALAACASRESSSAGGCDRSLTLPDGFCATVVADTLGHIRHIAIRPNGDIFAARLAARGDSGGITAVRGSHVVRFGAGSMHGLALAPDSSLYASTAHEILRFRFKGDSLAPRKNIDTIVAGIPGGATPDHSILLDGNGALIVGIPAMREGCAAKTPCPDLSTTAGIWRFSAGKKNQTMANGSRIATGLRSAMALAIDPSDTTVYAVSGGPDSLHERFPQIDAFTAASHPGDEMIRVASVRADYGWPYCYFDVIAGSRVQSPEYGGDGRAVGNCDRTVRPVMSFPAHWNPMSMLFATGDEFPAKYRDGAFVAFHGSSQRNPLPEDGYAVAFVPFRSGAATMDFEAFASGFAGASKTPTGASHRPVGLAWGPDGSLYVSDDKGGRIWKLKYTGTGK